MIIAFVLGAFMAGGITGVILMACLQVRHYGLLEKQHEYTEALEESNKFLREAIDD